jgi:type VI secretion system secreted protein Hcp
LFVGPVAVALVFGYVAERATSSATSGPAKAPTPVSVSATDLVLAAAHSRNGIFLQFDGITGPPSSTHTAHAALSSFQWGVKRGVSNSSEGRILARPSVNEIVVTKTTDKYSVPLLGQSLTGNGSPNAVIYFTHLNVRGASVDYLEFDLQRVVVSGFSMSSHTDTPTESLSLNFTKVTIKAHIQGAPTQMLVFNLSAPAP